MILKLNENISTEFNLGNAHIEIRDDYAIHDPVKVQEILDRIGMIGVKASEKERGPDRAATQIGAM